MEICSYRSVFDLERRIYRVDRLRLNPGGVPVRGVVYFLVFLAACMGAGVLPLLGVAVRALPWYVRDLALPGASAAVLSVIRLEGRPFHLAAQALVRYRIEPRRLTGGRRCSDDGRRWRPEEILLLPDGSDSRLRRLSYKGPGAVMVAVEHVREGRVIEHGPVGVARWGTRRVVTLKAPPQGRPLGRGQVIQLGPRARLYVRANTLPEPPRR